MTQTIWLSDQGTLTFDSENKSSQVTDINVSGGTRDIDEINTFGTSGGYPSSIVKENRQELFETKVTLILQEGYKMLTHILGGTDVVMPISLNGATARLPITITYEYSDGDADGERVRITYTEAYATDMEITHESDNGALELSMTLKCLSKNFKYEYTDDNSTSPLP